MDSDSLKRRGYSISALREMARRTLPRPIFDFADGGAEDETTLRRNETAFDAIQLLPKPLEGAETRDLSVSLLGSTLALPVIIGPTGLAGLFWPDGERAAARAAQKAGTAYCLSHASVCTMERLAETDAAPRWMQVFVFRDRGFTRELSERAAAAGYDALMLTVDNQMIGNRERDVRNGFAIPPRLNPLDIAAMVLKTPYLWRMRREFRNVTFGNYLRPGENASSVASLASQMASMLDPSMSWDDVEELRRIWKGPLILKGILHPDEARKAVEHGIDAVVVSNHGGRQLDGASSAIEALPAVVAAIDGRMPVMVDGGVRRGADVVKALALGAAVCLIARPQLWGLAVAGEAGVVHVLDLFRTEIDRVMALCGAKQISDINAGLLAVSASHGNRAERA